jgi:hypothetical protein
MTQDKLSFNTIGGPSKFDLMLSLFDGNKDLRRTVEFRLEGAREPIVVAVTSVQQEDGSGERWNFEGRLTNYRRGFSVRGYYSSNSRKGYITFIVPFHYEMKGDVRHKIERQADQRDLNDYIEWLRGKSTGWPVPPAHVYTTHRG